MNDAEQAFPKAPGTKDGMSLRDWFAGQAIMGLATDARVICIAEWAYTLADAMMEERKERKHK